MNLLPPPCGDWHGLQFFNPCLGPRTESNYDFIKMFVITKSNPTQQ
jgi:hypothetical protein